MTEEKKEGRGEQTKKWERGRREEAMKIKKGEIKLVTATASSDTETHDVGPKRVSPNSIVLCSSTSSAPCSRLPWIAFRSPPCIIGTHAQLMLLMSPG